MRLLDLLRLLSAFLCTTSGPVPTPIGVGALYHPSAASPRVAHAEPVGRLGCSAARVGRFGIHLELFANRRVMIVPAGIGIAPPLVRDGATVRSGRCSYPVRTRLPTGVFEIERGRRLTLGELFAVWGRPLSRSRLAGYRVKPGERIRAWVGGCEWSGPLGRIPLRRHAQIVLEGGGFVPPHASFLFPPGL
ncbi:MAG TPA: hypothetical protein VF101_00095 [Gaiellaceae bacterium]